ncbi:hypothetical protein AC579_6900 [Pseudocercospora musae]|uniref:Uncharacterized protein n=1 Tax=Pseudocercospora musae TaxID=113226 RepID=A0A139IGH3_9PEZI|nr:hypothetical protein AC579_6900 [Pseudocercospora musae]
MHQHRNAEEPVSITLVDALGGLSSLSPPDLSAMNSAKQYCPHAVFQQRTWYVGCPTRTSVMPVKSRKIQPGVDLYI